MSVNQLQRPFDKYRKDRYKVNTNRVYTKHLGGREDIWRELMLAHAIDLRIPRSRNCRHRPYLDGFLSLVESLLFAFSFVQKWM